MTTPGASAPDGSYVVGNPLHYGQDYNEGIVRTLVFGQLPTPVKAVDQFEDNLAKLPIDVLLILRPFCLGSTDADWADSDIAAATIVHALSLRQIALTIEKFQEWLDQFFKPLREGVQVLIDGILTLFDPASIAAGVHSAQAAVAGFQKWVHDIFEPLRKLVQTIVDQVSNILGIGDPSTNHPIGDFVDGIAKLLGLTQGAQYSADLANIGVAQLRAERGGGSADEFNYGDGGVLPAGQYDASWTWGANGGGWVTDGGGVLVWRPVGAGVKGTIWRLASRDFPTGSGMIEVVVAKPPHSDPLVQSFVYICHHMSATDKSCIRWAIQGDKAICEQIDAAGNVARALTPWVPISMCNPGDTFTVKYAPGSTELQRNYQTVSAVPISTLPGRSVAFGAYVPIYTWLGGHPAPEFAGWAWS